MGEHTQGPWKFIEDDGRQVDDCLGPYTICDEARNDLASVYSRENATVAISRTCAIANARLIATAPDLLKAALMLDSLETRIDHGDEEASADWPHAMTALRAAIAKAC